MHLKYFNGYRRGAYEDPSAGMSADERNSEAMQNVQSRDWLVETFGVRFRYNAIGDINATEIVPSSDCFGITEKCRVCCYARRFYHSNP